jgi:translation initiation factor 1
MKSACKCKTDRVSKPPKEQTIKVRFEKKGRGGKAVTILDGFALSNADLTALLKELKGRCACGGTVDGGNLELQGDQRDRAIELLLKKGYKAKKAGG